MEAVTEKGTPWSPAAWTLCHRWSMTMALYMGFQMLSAT